LTSSQASADLPWQPWLPGCEPSLLAKSIPSAAPSLPSNSPESPTLAIFDPSQLDESDASPGCLQADFLVSLIASPGSEGAQQMTARSGRKCSALLMKPSRLGCLLKTCLESSAWNSTVCWLTWKPFTTPAGRLLFQLAPSMPITGEIESGLWPTPRSRDWKGKTQRGDHAPQDGLPNAVGGSLNPTWVEWLMGYPFGHTALKHWVMPSSRSSPRNSFA
jgi:hypothetical protein